MRARLYGCVLAGLLAQSCLLALAGQSGQRVTETAAQAAAGLLTVVFSTETGGYLTPCGCSSPMVGGFPRRATYLHSVEKMATVVQVDNGDLTEAMGRQDELKAETLVDMFSRLKYDALNLGEKDFRLGLAYLQSLQTRFKGALLCANARGAGGQAIFKEYVVVHRTVAAHPVRVLIAGVLSGQFEPQITALQPDVHIEAPVDALARLRSALAAEADLRILLYHGPKAEAEEIARQYPLFQLVVCAHEGDHPIETSRVGSASLVCSGQNGKYMGQARFGSLSGAPAPEVKYTALGPDFADDAEMLALKAAYRERVAAEDLLGKVPRVPTSNGDTFAGSQACAACHADAYRIWKASGHAHALDSLARVKEDADPECVACHVVGLGRVGGFVSREKTAHLQDVGCESCHGAASKHVKDPTVPMARIGPDSCQGCHNPQNSPNFVFEKYWPKVKH